MNTFEPVYGNEGLIIHYLQIAIGLCIEMTLIFLVFLYVRRIKKIYDAKLKRKYNPVIDNLLFPLLFNDKPIGEIIASKEYRINIKHEKFQKILLESIIDLHTNYSGDYNLKLEEIYRESGLIYISSDKLKSESWSSICEGIRELSEMNADESYTDILALIQHKHSTLKLEALLGIIRLKGIAGLAILNDYQKPINDWIQLSLIYEINNAKHTSVYDFAAFIVSENESLIIFGLRLIANFNQAEHIEQIIEICNSTSSERIRKQAGQTITKLTSLNFNY
jgi:hypothetical protein